MEGPDAFEEFLRSLRQPGGYSPVTGTPIHVRAHLKYLERQAAVKEGLAEVPDYAEEELHYLYQEDLLDAAGEGTIAAYRDAAAWQTEKARELLAEWQAAAQERLKRVEAAGSGWRDVYNNELGE